MSEDAMGPSEFDPDDAGLDDLWQRFESSLVGAVETNDHEGGVEPIAILRSGEPFGRYELREELGRGGQGRVFRAFDLRLDREVALKITRWSEGPDGEARRRLEREARALARIAAGNIARVFEFGWKPVPYVAVELIAGRSLAAILAQDGPPPRAKVLAWFESLARTLDRAHEHGIMHRDFKPANIMINPDGEPILLDFGMAKDLRSLGVTREGSLLGTPAYLPPESLARGAPIDEARRDIYAVGVSMFECLTGNRPYAGPTRAALFAAIEAGVPRPFSELPQGQWPAAAWVALRAMALRPEDRYRAARDLAEDLSRLVQGLPPKAQPPRLRARARAVFRRHRKAVFAALAFALLALSATLLIDARRQAAARAADVLQAALDARARLSDVVELRRLVQESSAFWPIEAELVAPIESWNRRRAELALRRSGHENSRRVLAQGSADLSDDEAFRYSVLLEIEEHWQDLEDGSAIVTSVSRRYRRAQQVQRVTVTEQQEAWRETLHLLASDARLGMAIEAPIPGLIPLGPDPDSGLLEFLHWASHDPTAPLPNRSVTSSLSAQLGQGLILVLWPGAVDSSAARPLLIGKHEVTQDQWLRWTGSNPAQWPPEISTAEVTLLHPVEGISATEAIEFAKQCGLRLPTRAERTLIETAGSSTQRSSEVMNIADRSYAEVMGEGGMVVATEHDDGFPLHAPVGSFPPSSIGLHDCEGNVWEWCFDGGHAFMIGGSFASSLDSTKASRAMPANPSVRRHSLGLRVLGRWPPRTGGAGSQHR